MHFSKNPVLLFFILSQRRTGFLEKCIFPRIPFCFFLFCLNAELDSWKNAFFQESRSAFFYFVSTPNWILGKMHFSKNPVLLFFILSQRRTGFLEKCIFPRIQFCFFLFCLNAELDSWKNAF